MKRVVPLPHVCPALNPAGTFSSAATAVRVIPPLLWVTGCQLPDGFGHLCRDLGVFGEEESALAAALSVDRDR